MGLMSKILGGNQSRTVEDYAELDLEDASMGSAEATMQVHIAEVGTKADAIDIKDAVYDGDIVIADITRLRTEDSTVEHIVDELRQVAQEVDGDIVRKGEDQMIITPTGIHISREKLGQKLWESATGQRVTSCFRHCDYSRVEPTRSRSPQLPSLSCLAGSLS